jgi:hypothetical protein
MHASSFNILENKKRYPSKTLGHDRQKLSPANIISKPYQRRNPLIELNVSYYGKIIFQSKRQSGSDCLLAALSADGRISGKSVETIKSLCHNVDMFPKTAALWHRCDPAAYVLKSD